jgi:hypothetical protein
MLSVAVGDEVDVARLVRDRDFTELGEGGIQPLALAEREAGGRSVPGDLGTISIDRVLAAAEGRPQRDVIALDPGHRPARIGAEGIGRDVAPVHRGRIPGQLTQREAERLLEAHRGGKGEGALSAQRLFQGREADARLFGKPLTGDAAPRQFFANHLGDSAALPRRKLFVGRRHGLARSPVMRVSLWF